MLYGRDNGDAKLRINLAAWLTSFFRPSAPVTEHRVCITGGASQNLACILQVFTDPVYTRHVWLVAPAYMLAFRIFEDSALRLRAVPEDEEGIDLDYLRAELKKSEEKAQAQAQGDDQLVSSLSGVLCDRTTRDRMLEHHPKRVPEKEEPHGDDLTWLLALLVILTGHRHVKAAPPIWRSSVGEAEM